MSDLDCSRPISNALAGIFLSALIVLTASSEVEAQVTPTVQGPGSANFNPGSLPATSPYIMGGGDLIRIDNFQIPEYSGEYLLPPDGVINLPEVGSVSLQGLTLEQANDTITAMYNQILRRPRIAVKLLRPRALTIVVAGEVNTPGSYIISREDQRFPGLRAPTVTDVIELAGGVTQEADMTQIEVRRTQSGNAEQIIRINLWQFLQQGAREENISLLDGDTIIVPTAENVSMAQSREVATSSLALDLAAPRTVAVVGEVTQPGVYVVLGGDIESTRVPLGLPTVTRALELAGGTTLTADISQIQVRRPTKTGGERIFDVDLWQLLQNGDLSQDLILQDGDTIIIPTAREVNPQLAQQLGSAKFGMDLTTPRTVVVVGEVNRPGSYIVFGGESPANRTPVGLPTVTRAIQLAGGITPDADLRRIQISRPTQTGGQQVFTANLWQLLQVGDFSQDQILQEGDTIFIPTASEISPAEAQTIASSSIAPANIQVYVVGPTGDPRFFTPTALQVSSSTSLNQALFAAGGLDNPRAQGTSVELIRQNPNGTISQKIVTLDFSAQINEVTNPLLRNNDIIVVSRSGVTRFAEGLQNALGSIVTLRQVFEGPMQALRFLEMLGIIRLPEE
ncbi:SLBB domain-containing protein [Laspinema palackyanum]|uniref:SLBB domain-containing protein n=1 Tax=Laspinema palackyanum TaxID=3231601 RepID=UPI00345DE834|nr:SLBB domain-containing protein [Laspinema sp. D2c]